MSGAQRSDSVRQFRPGDTVTVREVWQGKVWTVRREIVVRDEPGVLALYIPHGTPWLRPVDANGFCVRLPGGDWSLREEQFDIHHLGLAIPGEPYSVILMWEPGWRLRWWYINLEEPLTRTPQGFDFMDRTLDIVVAPDMSSWRWKDEDELAEAVDRGVISADRARRLWSDGEQAVERLLARKPPFHERWEDWRPNPMWVTPAISNDWGTAKQT